MPDHLPIPPIDRVVLLQSPPPLSKTPPYIKEDAPYEGDPFGQDMMATYAKNGTEIIIKSKSGKKVPVIIISHAK